MNLGLEAFLQAVNSPRMGLGCYFDVGNVIAFGYPAQWCGRRSQRRGQRHQSRAGSIVLMWLDRKLMR
jgi:hypothetical protein